MREGDLLDEQRSLAARDEGGGDDDVEGLALFQQHALGGREPLGTHLLGVAALT